MTDTHRLPVRVYFEDTDSGGIVYYANYLKFAERARTEMLRSMGIESGAMMLGMGVGLAVRRCSVEYFNPAKLDDELVVETVLSKVGGASMELRQTVTRQDEALVQMDVKLGCIHFQSGRPVALPKDLRAGLQKQVQDSV